MISPAALAASQAAFKNFAVSRVIESTSFAIAVGLC
jgi:hypothetical protein